MTENVWSWNIERFLAEAASSAPTPGGGSVAAYVGALGASMVSMVANLTIGKEKYKDVQGEVGEILQQSQVCLTELQHGLTEDIQVFNQFMAVYKMPKETEEDKLRRGEQLQTVLKEATASPMAVARQCVQVLQLAERLAPIGNKSAISDVGVAAYLAESALKSALLSVDINLPQITDTLYVQTIKRDAKHLQDKATDILTETVKSVQQRL